MRSFRRLRVQLALLAFVAVYVPVLVLTSVALATQVTVTSEDFVRTDVGRSPWVFVTALVLGPVAVWVGWVVAGRAVTPLNRITNVADAIQATDLSRRIDVPEAPSEVQELADSFNRMIDRLEAASTAQRRFIEEVSHELRTPLAVISANVDVTLANPVQDVATYQESSRRTKAEVVRLRGLVDELLRGARHEAYKLDKLPSDLTTTVNSAVASRQPAASASDVMLVAELPDALIVDFDPGSVERCVGNLVDNAIRHSPPGATVTVSAGATSDWAWCRVADQGEGIGPDDHSRVFTRFWRGDPAASGFGLGLAIGSQVAAAHGGALTLSSSPGSGTCFVLWLPRRDSAGLADITLDGIHHRFDPGT